jgi:hypothetical protein
MFNGEWLSLTASISLCELRLFRPTRHLYLCRLLLNIVLRIVAYGFSIRNTISYFHSNATAFEAGSLTQPMHARSRSLH